MQGSDRGDSNLVEIWRFCLIVSDVGTTVMKALMGSSVLCDKSG